MANRRVRIYERVLDPTKKTGWTYRPVKIDLRETKLPKGRNRQGLWYVSWLEGKRRRWMPCRGLLNEAKETAHRKLIQLEGKDEGMDVVDPQDSQNGKRTPVADEMARYLVELRGTKRSDATLKLFRETFEDWADYCSVFRVPNYVEALKREDFLSFGEWLANDRVVTQTKNGVEVTVNKKPNVQTTVSHKLRRMSQWQRWSMKLGQGRGLITVNDAPIDDDMEVEEYTHEELDKFFAACKPDEHLLFTFFLQSGFREREVSTLPWSDLNLTTGIVKVQKRPEYGFTPKNRMSRSVKLPSVLVARLTIWRSQNLTAKLVFPSLLPDAPDGHMLRRLKQIAERAGLNPDEWWLHKFRATYATGLLRGGMDIREVQVLLGHKDLKSTMRYLAAIHVEKMGAQIDAIQFGSW